MVIGMDSRPYSLPDRKPTVDEIDEAVAMLLVGASWKEVGARFDLGRDKAQAWLRKHTSPKVAATLNETDPGPPEHGTAHRYRQTIHKPNVTRRACIPGVGACDACKHANARYVSRARHGHTIPPETDQPTLEWVADLRASGVKWRDIANRWGCFEHEARRVWFDRVLPMVADRCEAAMPTGDGPSHGTTTRYLECGCRCPACFDNVVKKHRERDRRRAMGRLGGRDMVDADKAVRHLHELRAGGASLRNIARAAGMQPACVQRIYAHPERRITFASERKVLSVSLEDALTDVSLVPVEMTAARVRRMLADGWLLREISEETGVVDRVLRRASRGEQQRVQRWIEQRVKAVAGRPAPDPERRRRALERQEAERRRSEAATRARYTVLRRERARQREDSR